MTWWELVLIVGIFYLASRALLADEEE